MHLNFQAISEPGEPGAKWQKLYNTHWPAYRKWLLSKKRLGAPTLRASRAALKKHMPEMVPTYNSLCKLVKADRMTARFLTGFKPPGYLSGCAQAVLKGEEPRLIRNYDYHPNLLEGVQLLSSWNGKKVIATSDCLIGALDGINEDGLAISLSFGGSKKVGYGFGIPFIIRYVLEFCSTLDESVEALCNIPSHMAYNVTVIDKKGAHKTVMLAPDRIAEVTDDNFATNHQGEISWPQNAAFNKTLERSASLEHTLSISNTDADSVLNAFLSHPLYSERFSEGFGTLYTAEYEPKNGKVNLYWPGEQLSQEFDNFIETHKQIKLSENSSSSEEKTRLKDHRRWRFTLIKN